MGTLSIGTIEQSCSSSSRELRQRHADLESLTNRGFLVSRRLRSDLSRSLLARIVCNGEKFSWPEFLTPKKSEAATKKHSRGQVIFSRASSRIRPSALESSEIQVSFKSHPLSEWLRKTFCVRPDRVFVGSRAPFDGRDMQGALAKKFPKTF